MTFDYRAGWGTDAFEDDVADDFEFPPRWVEPDDRYDAADILLDNFDLLDEMAEQRLQVLQAAYVLGDVEVERDALVGDVADAVVRLVALGSGRSPSARSTACPRLGTPRACREAVPPHS